MSRTYQRHLLHPELQKIVKYTPPVNFQDIDQARKGIDKMHRFLPKVNESGVLIEERLLTQLEHHDHAVPIRIYRPQVPTKRTFVQLFHKTQQLPAMVFMHWGGFCVGDLRTEHARCIHLCRAIGMVVISIDYRLAPEHPFPCGLEDCYAVLGWTHQQAKTLGIDPQKIAVGGTSAGGGLAAGLALKARDLGGPPIALQYLGFPVLDHRCSTDSAKSFVETPNWTSEANRLMWQYYLKDRTNISPYAAPSSASDLSQLPPTYLWTAEFDPLRDEGIAYALRLLEAGVSVELHNFPNTMHGFDSAPIEQGIVLRARQAQVVALKRFFKIQS
ncbi:MAG: alpha/beta hydrolase [Bacteroidota bacterium]